MSSNYKDILTILQRIYDELNITILNLNADSTKQEKDRIILCINQLVEMFPTAKSRLEKFKINILCDDDEEIRQIWQRRIIPLIEELIDQSAEIR